MKSFSKKVFKIVAQIRRGKTRTYKEVARLAGSPHAYRAVGNILAKNYSPAIPCHRVVRSDGDTGGYNQGREKKKALLQKEGAF
ncbi:MAG: MGMT family protein [Parcubacteria group bacterium]|nr:MGMT family protein [Parcubacteria group bacterium]